MVLWQKCRPEQLRVINTVWLFLMNAGLGDSFSYIERVMSMRNMLPSIMASKCFNSSLYKLWK